MQLDFIAVFYMMFASLLKLATFHQLTKMQQQLCGFLEIINLEVYHARYPYPPISIVEYHRYKGIVLVCHRGLQPVCYLLHFVLGYVSLCVEHVTSQSRVVGYSISDLTSSYLVRG